MYLYDGGVQIGFGLVAPNGNWTLNLTPTTTGPHSFTVRQQAADTGFLSTATAFTVTAYTDPGAPGITSVSTPAHTHTTASVTVTGTGVAGQTIRIYDGSGFIKTVVVASNGTWSTTVSLAVGIHTLTATQSPAAGLESAPSASRSVTVVWG